MAALPLPRRALGRGGAPGARPGAEAALAADLERQQQVREEVILAKQAEWDRATAAHQEQLSAQQREQEELKLAHEKQVLLQAQAAQRAMQQELEAAEESRAKAARDLLVIREELEGGRASARQEAMLAAEEDHRLALAQQQKELRAHMRAQFRAKSAAMGVVGAGQMSDSDIDAQLVALLLPP